MSNDTELLHASVIKRIWEKCKEEDMDIVAFAWRIQREAERAAVQTAQPAAVGWELREFAKIVISQLPANAHLVSLARAALSATTPESKP